MTAESDGGGVRGLRMTDRGGDDDDDDGVGWVWWNVCVDGNVQNIDCSIHLLVLGFYFASYNRH